MNYTKTFTCLGLTLCLYACTANAQQVLHAEKYKHYVDSFNAQDNELYPQLITNSESWAWMQQNIPLLDCPDKQLEKTYYFRWWTYRKHIRKTPEGFVILEFLPDVSWAGKYNTINCAAALHVYEGRWLHNAEYINDYTSFWYNSGGNMKAYSCWMADALYKQAMVTGNFAHAETLLPALVKNYEDWQQEKLDSTGLYWQVDGNDGMEVSVCGALSPGNDGYRPTINAYMYGDAKAIAALTARTGNKAMAGLYTLKAWLLQQKMQQKLWDSTAQFFKTMPRTSPPQLCPTRELLGYTPWLFNMPARKYSAAWRYLVDTAFFYAPYGPTTAERNSPGFAINYSGHECQWNGPSWPLATAITLTAMANELNTNPAGEISKTDYLRLITTYARSQQRVREDGVTVPWIDENLNPFTGDWISRTRLKNWDSTGWSAEKGGVERGKDYNHSTFCDLVITGLAGLRPSDGNVLTINPLLPAKAWSYFCLDNVLYHGKILTIYYDATGRHYRRGKGFFVLVNGKQVAHTTGAQKVVVGLK